jgi:DNA polymerase-1
VPKVKYEPLILPGFEDTAQAVPEAAKEEKIDVSTLPGADTKVRFEIAYVDTLDELDAAERALLDPSTRAIGLDIETSGLDPRTDRIRLVQLAIPDMVYVIDCLKVPVIALQRILDHGRYFIGHNIKFDLSFLFQNGLRIPNGDRIWCTKLAKQMLFAGTPEGYFQKSSLRHTGATFLGVSVDKTEQTSDWMAELTHAQLRYAAMDAAIVLLIARRQLDEIMKVGLLETAKLENRCLPAMVWMENTGILLDQKRWQTLEDQALLEHGSTILKLNAMAGTNRAVMGCTQINWNSPAQVARILQGRGNEVTSTREQALVELAAGGEELAQELVKLRHLSKRIGTYGESYFKWINPVTGRIHPDFQQLGAQNSGRMSCNEPNVQQIPRLAAYRACIIAPDSHWLVKADLSQIELRVASVVAPDYTLQDVFTAGSQDVHELTAQRVLNVTTVDKEARQQAKAVNFGFVFGMGATKFQVYAFSTYGVRMEIDDALRFRKSYFNLYPGLLRWHRSQPNEPCETRTLGGRRRLAVARFSEKLNTPVQGTAADGIKNALATLWEERDLHPNARPTLCVHDEIVMQCADGYQQDTEVWLKETMEKAMAKYIPEVPVLADTKISRNWSMA